MKYRFLLFDLDSTLFDFKKAEEIALTKFLSGYGVLKEEMDMYKDIYRNINGLLWKRLEEGKIEKEYLINNRFYLLFKAFDREFDGKKLADEYEEIMGLQGQHIQGADIFLKNLKEKGFKIYAITNGITSIQKKRLENSDISKYFDGVFISQEIGYQKPDVEFFDYVASHISDFNKEESLVIGDSLTADIRGANNFGVDSIWFNYYSLKKGKDIPTYEVSNYDEIYGII